MLGAAGIVRPGNVAISAVAVAIGALVAVGPAGLAAAAVPLGGAVGAVAAFTAAGNALNDYFDAQSDRVNHPERPIPRGRITRRGALDVAAVLFAAAVALAAAVNAECLAIVLVNLAAMVSYETSFKARGASGNLLIALLAASAFLFGGAAVYRGDGTALLRTASLALLAGLATLGREVAKDIEDAAGDTDRVTLPRAWGARRAGLVASAAFLAAVFLSGLPFLLGLLGLSYLVAVLAADAIFIYCALFPARTDRRIGQVSKMGMAVALLAFLVGALA